MTVENCAQCGKRIQPADKFCPACGYPAGQKTDNSPGGRRDHFIVVGILALIALVYAGYQVILPKSAVPRKQSQTADAASMAVERKNFIQNLPADFPSLVSMGNALMDQGRYELAVECYQKALELNPRDVDVIVDLGTCQYSLGQNFEAIEKFKKALEYAPDHQVAKFNLGIVYLAVGENEQAVASWKRLLSENPPPELKQHTETLLRQIEGN